MFKLEHKQTLKTYLSMTFVDYCMCGSFCVHLFVSRKAIGQHGQPTPGLSVKGTVSSSSPLYPGRPRYDNSELREQRGTGMSSLDLTSDKVG